MLPNFFLDPPLPDYFTYERTNLLKISDPNRLTKNREGCSNFERAKDEYFCSCFKSNKRKIFHGYTQKQYKSIEVRDLVKFVMCILVFRDCIHFFKYIKRVYPGNYAWGPPKIIAEKSIFDPYRPKFSR